MENLLFPDMMVEKPKVVNVSSVPQRSPFRYAGGKSWLIPVIRKWLKDNKNILVEPFLGGGSISLSACMENLTELSIMVELDEEVASVWKTILSDDCDWLIEQIKKFVLEKDNVLELMERNNKSVKEQALLTIIKNRVYHGGILASGAGFMKRGESGKGLGSRWYPETLCKRIREINCHKERFEFHHGDAFDYIRNYMNDEKYTFFIDPPYTVAGKRLYNHSKIDHEELFNLVSQIKGHYMLTYDNCDYIKDLASQYGFKYTTIPMMTTHLIRKEEIIISDTFDWMSCSKEA